MVKIERKRETCRSTFLFMLTHVSLGVLLQKFVLYSLVSLTGINPKKTKSKLFICNELRVSLAPKLQHNRLKDMLILEKMHVSKKGGLRDTKCSRNGYSMSVNVNKLWGYKGTMRVCIPKQNLIGGRGISLHKALGSFWPCGMEEKRHNTGPGLMMKHIFHAFSSNVHMLH